MNNYSNQLLEANRDSIPPAQFLNELFEQQRSETDALRNRTDKLEQTFKPQSLRVFKVLIGALIGLSVAAVFTSTYLNLFQIVLLGPWIVWVIDLLAAALGVG